MIVDASAVLAVLLREADGPDFMRAFSQERELSISPVNYVEACARLMGRNENPDQVDELMELANIRLVEVSVEQTKFAREAYQRFGKGNHPAKLNLGDCFAYALSQARGEPLLFKGDDFRKTDVEAAL
jgi:ribonuclease VapC